MFSAIVLSLLAVSTPGQDQVLVFHAEWCAQCRQMQKTIELLAGDVPVRIVNVDLEPEVARQYRVDHIPAYVVLTRGREFARGVGVKSVEELRAILPPTLPRAFQPWQVAQAHERITPSAGYARDSDSSKYSGPFVSRPIQSLTPASSRLNLPVPTEPVLGSPREAKAIRENAEVLLMRGMDSFALDTYRMLARRPGNIVFSPIGLSTALAMTFPGARGTTAREIASLLGLRSDRVSTPAWACKDYADLLKQLHGQSKDACELVIANGVFRQKGHPWQNSFVEPLSRYFDAGLHEVDFAEDTMGVCDSINGWVEGRTAGRIKSLVDPGGLNAATRLVLTNVVYYKGRWATGFDARDSRDEDFVTVEADGRTSTTLARMMHATVNARYADNGSIQVLELPYKGNDLCMLVLLPKETGGLPTLERELAPDRLADVTARLRRREVDVTLPSFTVVTDLRSIPDVLKSLGMVDAFDPAMADFSGMDGQRDICLSDVIQRAFIQVNEEGTEAAAATGIMTLSASYEPPPPKFRCDHPFVLLIRHNSTGSILFISRVVTPSENDASMRSGNYTL